MNLPLKWELVSIADVTKELKSGLSRKLSTKDIGLPVIRSTNITDDGRLLLDDIKYWHVDDPQGADTAIYFLKKNDFLINFINSASQIGKAALYMGELGRESIYTTNIMRLRVNIHILQYYLLYLTRTFIYRSYIHSITKPAVNQASFTTKDFKKFTFPLPPLLEQRKIASILGTSDEAITLTERLIAAKQQRKKALMQQLLTGKVRFGGFAGEWHLVSIADVIQELKSGLSRKLSTRDIGLPVIRSTNIAEDGRLILDKIKYWYVDDPQGANTAAYFIRENDLLVNFINSISQIGKAALYMGELRRDSIYTTNIMRLRVNSRILPNYLLYLTKTSKYKAYIHSITKPAVNQASFTTKDLKRFAFPLPSLEEQRKIASVLRTCDDEISLLQQKAVALRQQKKGLMQQLLTGKVRVKGCHRRCA